MKRIFFVLLIACSFVHAQEKEDTVKVVKQAVLPKGYTSQIDVVYTSGKNWQQKMDLYLPPNTGKPTPAIINIHGGGWNHGTKESQSGGFNSFFKIGFAVANVEYRMTGEATAPAAVEDIRCALIYLFKNAAVLNIDTSKIVIMGGSAGGHLALLAGLMGNNHTFDTNCAGVENIHVAAIIDKYGIADMDTFTNVTKYKSAIKWLGNYATDQKFIKSVSPVTYITKNSPPVFIVHGDADPTVPYTQSVALHQKLVDAGVKTEFITVPGGGHGGFAKDKMSEVSAAIIVFIKANVLK
jgi:acetyl esterase/lipase